MRTRLGEWVVAVLVALALVALHGFTGDPSHRTVRHLDVGQTGRLYGSTVTVHSWSIGQVLYRDDSFVGRTGVMFLAVNLTVATDKPQEPSSDWQLGAEANGRTFASTDELSPPQPGFQRTQDVVFELNPDDLAGISLTVLDRAPIYAFDPQLTVDLGITEQRAADELSRARYATVKASTGTDQVIR